MIRRLILIAILAVTFVRGLSASQPEELFKWGEYDSLIRLLEPAASNPGALAELRTRPDSLLRAKSFLFLGVAFFATGRMDRADEAFGIACGLDPEVKLDRFYVTEEIANHFQAIALDGIRRRNQKAALSQASAALSDRARPVRGTGPAWKSRDGKDWIWWGLGVTALVAAGGGAIYFSSQSPEGSDNVTTIDARKEE
ncbi:MAG: hypothetical protein JWP91_2755 [Fibrobacteres bacterium]|nr:hypothetical protein [Fibrobacterota bacterium]